MIVFFILVFPVSDDRILELLGDGNESDIEEFHDDEDFEVLPRVLVDLVGEDDNSEDSGDEMEPEPLSQVTTPNRGRSRSTPLQKIGNRGRSRGTTSQRMQSRRERSRTAAIRRNLQQHGHGDTWKSISFTDKPHDYTATLPKNPVRTPFEYLNDYFDEGFYEETARCTNLYFMRKTGQELKTTKAEIAKVFGVHILMGCLPYPRMPMYWRANMRIGLIADKIVRDRFITLRNALHVVDHDQPTESETNNLLWKVQLIIKRVQDTCNKLERVPCYYSVDEQMIPFSGRCSLRQVVKNKPRPEGLKNFVLTTSEGLMLDFEIYRGANTMFGDTSLGLGPSVILHLTRSVPPGSCVYHDRFFTTVPLVEEMNRRNIHSTGTIMFNRIPDRAACKFKQDSAMIRGESQHYTRDSTVIVKWKDNKSVIMASNCTGSSSGSTVKRWDKKQRGYIDVPAPKIIQQYNQHMGGVDILDQQMEYYRTFIKTKKWTLKVIIHFLDLALVNSWRLYKNDCVANGYSRKDTLTLLDFRFSVADTLTNFPEQDRRNDVDDSENEPPPINRQYRPIRPSQGKRYDGYDHLAVFDDIKAPRSCMMEGCHSRSKIKCSKCAVYLCLSRNQNCFQFYHLKP